MSDADSVEQRATYSRASVVEVLQSLEELLSNRSRVYLRASDLEADLPARQIGSILGMLADSALTVADIYQVPEATHVHVSRWGRTDNTVRWEVRWSDA